VTAEPLVSDSGAPARSKEIALDTELSDEIRRHRRHPFLLLRLAADIYPQRFIVCDTQNELRHFKANIAAMPWFARSRLIRSVVRALEREIDEAADLLCRWLDEPALA
jgi:hypothetical protein